MQCHKPSNNIFQIPFYVFKCRINDNQSQGLWENINPVEFSLLYAIFMNREVMLYPINTRSFRLLNWLGQRQGLFEHCTLQRKISSEYVVHKIRWHVLGTPTYSHVSHFIPTFANVFQCAPTYSYICQYINIDQLISTYAPFANVPVYANIFHCIPRYQHKPTYFYVWQRIPT